MELDLEVVGRLEELPCRLEVLGRLEEDERVLDVEGAALLGRTVLDD